jgi:diguanylate cyclase
MTNVYAKDAAAECLRLALPLMSKYKIPVTPANYAVWFEYVAGTNSALKADIDNRIERQETLDAELTGQLYKVYVAKWDDEKIEDARRTLLSLAESIRGSVGLADGDMQRYQASLAGASQRLDRSECTIDLRQLVSELSQETETIRESGAQLRAMLEESRRESEALRQQLAQVRQEATTDPLTGLPNRKVFESALDDLVSDFEANGYSFCLIIVDIDRFKLVNDTHGHLVGDKVIRYVADTIRSCAKGKDLVVRMGGEEFALLLPETALRGAIALSEDIRRNVEAGRLVRSDNREDIGTVTVSLGAAAFRNGESAHSLIARADEALYRAKSSGRNQVIAEADVLESTSSAA